jgi:hypothetical protein
MTVIVLSEPILRGVERDLALGEFAFERVRIGLAVIVVSNRDAGGADTEHTEERAPCDLAKTRHGHALASLSAAARWIAARMRG